MKKFLIVAALSVLAALLAFGAYHLYFNTDLLRIRTIHYNESPHIDLDSICVYSRVEIGDSYFEVDIAEAEKGLLTHPYIRSVSGRKAFPNDVYFEIEYREHLLTVKYLDILLSVDENLVVLTTLQEKMPGHLIEGFPFRAFAAGTVLDVDKGYILRNAVSLIRLFRMAGIASDDEIDYRNGHLRFRVDGVTVDFGSGEDAEQRFNAFLVIIKDLKEKGAVSGVIDLSTSGPPVYRPFGD